MQIDSQFTFMQGRLVVLCEALPHLGGTETHDGVEVGVVIRRSMKYLDAQRSLF